MHKKSFLAGLAAILVSMLWLWQPIGAKTPPPAEGGQLPEFSLPVPKNPEFQNYLGLTDKQTFRIPAIDAQVVIIDIFSMY